MKASPQPSYIHILIFILLLAGFRVPGYSQARKLYPIPRDNKYGLVDARKNLVADYKYDYISIFRQGLAVIGCNRKYGIINDRGKELVPMRCDSLIAACDGLFIILVNDSLNIIDSLGHPQLEEWCNNIMEDRNSIFWLDRKTARAEEIIRNTIRHYELDDILRLDHDSVFAGSYIFGFYSKLHPALNGIWFSGAGDFYKSDAEVAISRHTYFVDTLGKIRSRKPYCFDHALRYIYIPDELPVFPGGKDALYKFMHTYIKYPAVAGGHRYQGRVDMQILIDDAGNVIPLVRRSLSPEYDAAVKDAILKMPKWKPARYKGKAVCWYYNYVQWFTIRGL